MSRVNFFIAMSLTGPALGFTTFHQIIDYRQDRLASDEICICTSPKLTGAAPLACDPGENARQKNCHKTPREASR